ncbi:reverse transcriptase domain-containing protein [Tanacetum coccineum]
MPNNVKTYDGSEDPKDHFKFFQAAAKVERWAMPTWCHMFNSTLTGSVRVWFDDPPPESIDSYDDLKKAFLANYLQQKKCIKDPVEIHHIKQRVGESMKDSMQRFKAESRGVKRAPECMRIFGFMHGITNPELIKRLYENIPKSVDETMRITTAFLRGEVAASNQQRLEQRRDKFTLLTKSPKEILALDKGKFKAPPPMTTHMEKRNSNKVCEFHGEVGHNTDECMHLKSQSEELIKNGKLSHVIEELKQDSRKDQPKTAKKGETSGKDKPLAILMVQPWQRVDRQKITQSISTIPKISFPPLGEEDRTEGPMIIEAEIGGHFIHRIYTRSKENSSSPINGSRNAEILGPRRSTYSTKQQDNPTGMHDGLQTGSTVFRCRLGHGRENQSGHSSGISRANNFDRLNSNRGGTKGIVGTQAKRAGRMLTNQAKEERPGTIKKQSNTRGGGKFGRRRHNERNLNKACPKDGYPLPEIDWKVESLYGYPFKSFLDAYKGYHQIKMAKEDEEKTTFITSQGIFCYSKMPFGLKNPEASYQRLVDKAFQKQIGRNLELNPKKCTFGIEEDMFPWLQGKHQGDKGMSEQGGSSAKPTIPKVSERCTKAEWEASKPKQRPEDDPLDTPMEAEEELPDPWTLFTDGSSCVDGSGAGLILTNPEGAEFTYALRFRFDATNNEVEYEALIVLVKELSEKSINVVEVLAVVEEEGDTWITPMYNYLTEETLPAEKEKARAIRRNTDRILLAHNACGCKKTDPGMSRLPVGPFPERHGEVKFLIVAMDYFTKWIEAKPVATITGNQVKKFVWDNIVCRFGLPGEIISDNGKQFRDNPFKDWCEKLCIRQRFASVKHPQASGLVERENISLGEGIKARLDERSKDWIEKVPHVFWAHRTMIKLSNGDTPFLLTYRTEAVIPVEIGMPTFRTEKIDIVQNNEALEINLDLLEERREQAHIKEQEAKQKMKMYYNSSPQRQATCL